MMIPARNKSFKIFVITAFFIECNRNQKFNILYLLFIANIYKMNSRRMKLNLTDYKNILKFYKIDTSGLSTKAIKEKAEHFLAVKLCKCIKNVSMKNTSMKKGPKNEKRAISICYNSVLKKKHLKVFKFECKKTVKLLPKKGTRKIFVEKLGV